MDNIPDNSTQKMKLFHKSFPLTKIFTFITCNGIVKFTISKQNRYIAGFSKCTTNSLPLTLTHILTVIKNKVIQIKFVLHFISANIVDFKHKLEHHASFTV